MNPLQPEEIAQICHEANRALQIAVGDSVVSSHWEEAPDWQTFSAIEGVEKAFNGATSEELHQSWCDYKTSEGWTYGTDKDETLKTHPCLVPYDQLPVEQRLKDHLFKAIVGVFG